MSAFIISPSIDNKFQYGGIEHRNNIMKCITTEPLAGTVRP